MGERSRRFARIRVDEGELSPAIYLDIKKDLQDQNKQAIVVAEQNAAQVRALLHDQFRTLLQHHEIRPIAARLDVHGNNNPQAIARYTHQHAIKEFTYIRATLPMNAQITSLRQFALHLHRTLNLVG